MESTSRNSQDRVTRIGSVTVLSWNSSDSLEEIDRLLAVVAAQERPQTPHRMVQPSPVLDSSQLSASPLSTSTLSITTLGTPGLRPQNSILRPLPPLPVPPAQRASLSRSSTRRPLPTPPSRPSTPSTPLQPRIENKSSHRSKKYKHQEKPQLQPSAVSYDAPRPVRRSTISTTYDKYVIGASALLLLANILYAVLGGAGVLDKTISSGPNAACYTMAISVCCLSITFNISVLAMNAYQRAFQKPSFRQLQRMGPLPILPSQISKPLIDESSEDESSEDDLDSEDDDEVEESLHLTSSAAAANLALHQEVNIAGATKLRFPLKRASASTEWSYINHRRFQTTYYYTPSSTLPFIVFDGVLTALWCAVAPWITVTEARLRHHWEGPSTTNIIAGWSSASSTARMVFVFLSLGLTAILGALQLSQRKQTHRKRRAARGEGSKSGILAG